MSLVNDGVSPSGVHVAGGFQGWNAAATEMLDVDGDLVFEHTATIDTTGMNGNNWGNGKSPTGNCATNSGNRFISLNNQAGNTLITGDADGNPHCFNSCTECLYPVPVTFNVDMSSQAEISSNGVCIAGS